MRRVHIPGGGRKSVTPIRIVSSSGSFFRSVSLALVLAGLIGTAACVGATGKSAGNGDTTSVNVSPPSMSYGNVSVKSSASHSFKLSNTGTTDVKVTNVTGQGPGFSLTGLSAPLDLNAGASVTFAIKFTPLAAGHETGTYSITTSADSSPVAISVDGTGVALPNGTPSIEVTPSPVNFGGVTIGTADSQTMRVTNNGTAELTITKISASGTGFSVSGLSIPTMLAAGKDQTFTAAFKPTASGNQTGRISISSNAAGSPLVVDLSASGSTTSLHLTPSVTSLNFGSLPAGVGSSKPVKLTNTGNADVAISSISVSGTGFSVSGGSDATLTPSQSITVSISFDPKGPGGVTGNLFVSSNAPKVDVGLQGQGEGRVVPHSVSLDWESSHSAVVGYNVYRGSVSGGPYTRVNPTSDANTSYRDRNVSGGLTYFYVVTAIDSSNIESGFSNQVSVKIPSP